MMRLKLYNFLKGGGPFCYRGNFSGLSNETVGATLYNRLSLPAGPAIQQLTYITITSAVLYVLSTFLSHINGYPYASCFLLLYFNSNISKLMMYKYAFLLTGNKLAAKAIVKNCNLHYNKNLAWFNKPAQKTIYKAAVRTACHKWLHTRAMEIIDHRKNQPGLYVMSAPATAVTPYQKA